MATASRKTTKKYTKRTPSPRAKRAAELYIESLGKGETPTLTKVLQEAGYSETTATKLPNSVTQQPIFKETVQNALQMMEKLRQKQLAALLKKDHDKVKYRDLVDGVDKITKNTQLLSGKETSRAGVIVQTVNYGELPIKADYEVKPEETEATECPTSLPNEAT